MRINKIVLSLITFLSFSAIVLSLFLIFPKNYSPPTLPIPFNKSTITSPPPLNFAIISDIHSDTIGLTKALEKAKEDKMQFVILTGDLTLEGSSEELTDIKQTLDNANIPYIAIPGNHDTWNSHQKKEDLYYDIFGSSFYTFTKNDIKFILLDNSDYLKGYQNVNDSVLGNQKTWLSKELKDCPQITCLVFIHMPLNHPTSSHIFGENDKRLTQEAKELLQLLLQFKIKHLFTGHIHIPQEYTLDGLTTTIVGGLSYQNQAHFLEVEIENKIIIKNNIEVK